jgi:hypothetical protein
LKRNDHPHQHHPQRIPRLGRFHFPRSQNGAVSRRQAEAPSDFQASHQFATSENRFPFRSFPRRHELDEGAIGRSFESGVGRQSDEFTDLQRMKTLLLLCAVVAFIGSIVFAPCGPKAVFDAQIWAKSFHALLVAIFMLLFIIVTKGKE